MRDGKPIMRREFCAEGSEEEEVVGAAEGGGVVIAMISSW